VKQCAAGTELQLAAKTLVKNQAITPAKPAPHQNRPQLHLDPVSPIIPTTKKRRR